METMIAKWIQETLKEYELAKVQQNVFKMIQMRKLHKGLLQMRDKLLISRN